MSLYATQLHRDYLAWASQQIQDSGFQKNFFPSLEKLFRVKLNYWLLIGDDTGNPTQNPQFFFETCSLYRIWADSKRNSLPYSAFVETKEYLAMLPGLNLLTSAQLDQVETFPAITLDAHNANANALNSLAALRQSFCLFHKLANALQLPHATSNFSAPYLFSIDEHASIDSVIAPCGKNGHRKTL